MASAAITVGFIALLGLLFAEYREHFLGRAICKTTASSCFVLLAVSLGATNSFYGQLLLSAMLLCWLGDVLLIKVGQGALFMAGIAAFLFGHVLYAFAFWQLELSALPMWLLAGLMIPALILTLRYLRPHLDSSMQVAVLAYMVAISIMVIIAAGAGFWLGLMAVLFAVSDLSVARDRFVKSGFSNVVWGLPLYYLSQFGIAASLLQ